MKYSKKRIALILSLALISSIYLYSFHRNISPFPTKIVTIIITSQKQVTIPHRNGATTYTRISYHRTRSDLMLKGEKVYPILSEPLNKVFKGSYSFTLNGVYRIMYHPKNRPEIIQVKRIG